MKKRLLIIAGLLLLLICGFGLWVFIKTYYFPGDGNPITVTTDAPLTPDKVKIEFGISVNTINRATDKDLFERREKYTVLYDGERENSMDSDYGENDFLITYDNAYYFSFRQFKTNSRYRHGYHFHFFQKDKTVFIRADIRGENAMQFERPMLDIRLADQYRCNVPLDSAGSIYNMIELN